MLDKVLLTRLGKAISMNMIGLETRIRMKWKMKGLVAVSLRT